MVEVKNPRANAKDIREAGLIPGSERFPEEGNGNQLQYSCLEENPMDRGAWQATVHGVTKSQTWLSTAKHQKKNKKDVSDRREYQYTILVR